MNNDRYVAAIEISSSKIIAVVGKAYSDGSLEIIASEQEKGVESVRYGIIKNLEETASRITRIIDKLERKSNVAPGKVCALFVGLSGRSVRGIPTQAALTLSEETEINDAIITRLLTQALKSDIDKSLDVVDAVPRTYKVDQIETESPKGMVGSAISANYDLIVCRPEIRRNLVRTIKDKLGIRINGIVVTSLATAQLILSPEEKRLGSMLVDMGAETTSVSIYKGGHLVYFATLPLGGRNITRDITSLNLLEERADELKITSGNAMPRETASTINHNGIRDVDVSNLIVARSEEIVINILKQVSYADLKDKDLPGGIICIGGGMKLNGILDLLQSKSGLTVRRGMLPSYIHVSDSRINPVDIIEVASVLYAGSMSNTEPCFEYPKEEAAEEVVEQVVEETKPVAPKNKFWRKLKTITKGGIAGMFASNDEDDSDLLD